MKKKSKGICFFPSSRGTSDREKEDTISTMIPDPDPCVGENILEEVRGFDEDREVQFTVYQLFHANIRHIPLLTPDEEKELSRRILEERDCEAYQQFILSNHRLVIACARRIKDRMGNQSILSFMDLVQEGILGLMTAVERFDYKRNTRFSTYGVPWIYQRMKMALVQYRYGITVPGYAGTSVHVMSDYIQAYREGRLGSIPEDVDMERVRVLARISAPVISIDYSEDDVSGTYTISPERLHADIEKVDGSGDSEDDWGDIESSFFREEMLDVLERELNPREYDVLCRRFGLAGYGSPQTLGDIAFVYGKSSEYVRTLVRSVLERLRENVSLGDFCEAWETYSV
jgi:RNA polymerase sigma factor (sigma-70 family)